MDSQKQTFRSLATQFYDDPMSVLPKILQLTETEIMREIVEAIHNNSRVLIISGNGTGKSYSVTMYALLFALFNYNSLTMITSGNYDLLTDASWRPMKEKHNQLQDNFPGAIGRKLESPPRIEFAGDQWFLRYISPRYPDNLEGRHARRALVVIEEADKPDISHAHFDSATSTASSEDDRVVAVANPPQDKGNVVYDKMESDRWKVINFSSFESHNVKVETGELEGEIIQGLVELDLLKEDWEAWNRSSWPGVEQARKKDVQNLSPRWYRRRLGIMPETGEGVSRPWYEDDVEAAVSRYQMYADITSEKVLTMGFDVARGGGDRTFGVQQRPDLLESVLDTRNDDHTKNEQQIADRIDEAEPVGYTHIDAVGEGSAVADNVRKGRTGIKRFQAGVSARKDDEYDDARTEAYTQLGQFLQGDGMIPPNSAIEEELRLASYVLEEQEKNLKANTVIRITGKDKLKKKEYLGYSPDALDACAMAVYGKSERESLYSPMTGNTA